MATYAQLASEPVWGAQFISPTMNAGLLAPLRAFYGLGLNAVGAAGDNNHLYGRHRSYNWDKTSIYCTNRSYGTTSAKDQGGNRNWYRAVDVGIQGQALFDASHRMDKLARSGACPGLAEWFGTFDGSTVVGWFEGQESSSDDSHLFHLHVGIWNEFADNAAVMIQIYNTITGTAPVPAPKDVDMFRLIDPDNAQFAIYPEALSQTGWSWTQIIIGDQDRMLVAGGVATANGSANDPNHDPHANNNWRPGTFGPSAVEVREQLLIDIAAKVVAALPPSQGGTAPTLAQITAAVRTELDKTKVPSVPGTLGI